MLICFDCEKEMRNEYFDKIRKKNGIKKIKYEQHSHIKRKLLEDDNISRYSRESCYTDNNSYNPTNKKYKKFGREVESSLNLTDSRNFGLDNDEMSIHSYNGIITDYSKRRRKREIKYQDKEIKESKKRNSNIERERKNNGENCFKLNMDENSIGQSIKDDRIIDNDMNYDNYDTKKKKYSSKDDEIDSNYYKKYNENEDKDNYSNKNEKKIKINKNNIFNNNEINLFESKENENKEDEMQNNNNKINNENINIDNNYNTNKKINKKNESLINQNNDIKIEFNNTMKYREDDNLSKNSEISNNILDKNENELENNRQKENDVNSPFISVKKNENKNKKKKYEIYIENNNNLYDSSSKKNINENNENVSESDEAHKSIYYEKIENNDFGRTKYIRRDKISRKKVRSKNKQNNNKNTKHYSDNKQLDNESYKENSENSDNMGVIIFNNKYIESEKNKINESYNEKNRIENRKILYQDFYFREVSFSSSSSVKDSINSDSKYNEYDTIRSYPEDRKIHKFEKCTYEINEPKEEFDKFIFEQINIIRANPKSFVQKIESSKKNIGVDKRNNYIYNGNQKILLNNGIYAFENAIKHLNVLRSMNKLKYNPEFNIKLPSNEDEINDRKYQNNMVNELLKNKIKIKSFWREIIKDPEECFLLMIVDDCGNNCGFKRKDLLEPSMNSIGISSIKLGKYFACYIQLGKK